jgi:hypothetical protein
MAMVGRGMQARWELKTSQAEFLDLDKVQDTSRLAQDLYPVRMVVVSGSFPLREQLHEFRRKLKKRSLSELSAMVSSGDAIWGFRAPEIERQTLTPDGKEITGWEPYNQKIEEELKIYLARAAQPEPEDERMLKLEGMINRGLVFARPPLARGGYPMPQLPNLMASIAKIEERSKADSGKHQLSFKSQQLLQQGIDVSNPISPIGTGDDATEKEKEAQVPEKQKEGETQAIEGDDLSVPEYALIRIVDATVEPGYVYRYRIKIRMANPNFGKHNLAYPALGKDEVISAAEFEMTPKVSVPNDTDWYAIDDKPNKDKMMLQLHHWVDYVFTNTDDPNSRTAIGDWTILEKVDGHRGEYIGHWASAKLPAWKVEKERFELAVNTRTQSKNIAVDFAARTSKSRDPALLLDYSGGKGIPIQPGQTGPKKVTEDLPVEALVLTPEGKLVVRRQQQDMENPARRDRLKSWQDWLFKVQHGISPEEAQEMINRRMQPAGREGGGVRRN